MTHKEKSDLLHEKSERLNKELKNVINISLTWLIVGGVLVIAGLVVLAVNSLR